jgi:hypothetical protein
MRNWGVAGLITVSALVSLPKPINPNETTASAIVNSFFMSSSLVRKTTPTVLANQTPVRSDQW